MQKLYLLGPTTWKVMQRNVWKDIASLQNKTTQQLYKVGTPCMDYHQFKEEENESVGEFSTACSQIALKCLYLARIGRPDILWSVNVNRTPSHVTFSSVSQHTFQCRT